jgi:predicted ATPase
VVLSAATQHLVSGRFDLDALGPQTLTGIGQPVQAYRALAVRGVSRFDAARERRLTPVVGRDEELGMLLRRWRLAVEGEGQAVLLSGEAGVGKSRIVYALQDSLAKSLTNRILCYCSPYYQSSAFHPVIDQLERATRISSMQTPREKLNALENVLGELGLDVVEAARLFAELLSIPYEGIYPALDLTPEQLRLRTLDVLVETVEAMAAQEPVLFVVEDAHWIDPSTQDFLTHLIERVRTSRTLVVITHRPEYEPLWTDYSHVTALALNNLGRRDSATMVAEVTKGRRLPKSMVEEIIDRTDGVPLFIEEISVALSDSGFIAEGDRADATTGDPTTASIPATLQDFLMERLDRLGPAKEVAQYAAVIGRSFTFDLLTEVSDKNEQDLEQDLALLVQSGLIYGRRGVESNYDFKHALVRDAAYQSLLRRDRQGCHQRIATALMAAGDNPPLEVIAHHFEEGGHPDKAAQYWRQAGERALGRFAHVEAISDLRRALATMESLPADSERFRFELEMQTLLGPSLMLVLGQGAPEVEQTYARALELGEQLNDSEAAFTSAWGMWRLQFARGDMKAGREFALKCQQVSARSTDPVANLGTAFALGATCLFSGDCSTAAPHLEDSIGLYRGMEDKSGLAAFGQDPGLSSLCYLAWARWSLGFVDQAVAPCEEAVQLARDIGKPVLIAVATGFAGLTYSMRRDIPRLTEYAEECLSICERHEFRQWAAMSNVALGYAYSHGNDHDRATALAEAGLNERAAIRSYIATPWFCYLAAETYVAAGRLREALEVARRGIAFSGRGAERFFEPENHRMQALILAKDPDARREEIEAHFNDALQLARSQKAKSFELRTAISFARFANQQGARDSALELLSPIYESFTEGFDTPDLKESKALLEELS